jgi:hypothetical protein
MNDTQHNTPYKVPLGLSVVVPSVVVLNVVASRGTIISFFSKITTAFCHILVNSSVVNRCQRYKTIFSSTLAVWQSKLVCLSV